MLRPHMPLSILAVSMQRYKQLYTEILKKNSGWNGIRTHYLCDAGAMLYQLSYQAYWELGIFLLFDLSSAVQNICFIYSYSFIHPLRVYYELTVWP